MDKAYDAWDTYLIGSFKAMFFFTKSESDLNFLFKELLATINQILLEDHLRAGFADCTDLPGFRERSPNSINNEVDIIFLAYLKFHHCIVSLF